MRLRLIGALRTRKLLEAADSLDILNRCSLNWKLFRRQELNISLLCLKASRLYAGIMTTRTLKDIFVFLNFTTKVGQSSDLGRQSWIGHQPEEKLLKTNTEYVGRKLVFCCSSAPRTPLTACVTGRQTYRRTDRQTDRHNKGALGLLVLKIPWN